MKRIKRRLAQHKTKSLSKTKNLLIVGQGIAGSLLGWHAEKRGLSFDIYDPDSSNNASSVSSGIINPVTGPKYVKSWMIDILLPYSYKVYNQISDECSKSIIRHTPLYHHLPDPKSENNWESRVVDPTYEAHVEGATKFADLDKVFIETNRFGVVRSALLVDVGQLISVLRDKWSASGVLHESRFHSEALHTGQVFNYDGRDYNHVVMAIGHHGLGDALFKMDSYRPIKGEVLICKIKSGPKNKIVKYGKFLVPIGGDLYWVGSNYESIFSNNAPDKVAVRPLIQFLNEVVQLDYEIIDHLAGISPATKYRRPLVGEHPTIKGLYLLNGLGTKGISIAPWFSHQVIEAIATSTRLTPTQAFTKSFIK